MRVRICSCIASIVEITTIQIMSLAAAKISPGHLIAPPVPDPAGYTSRRLLIVYELIECSTVTFMDAGDAKNLYDVTANGIVYKSDSESIHLAETQLDTNPTPVSSYVQQWFTQGATHCVKAIGVDPVISLQSLQVLAEGKTSSRGSPTRKLERLEDSMNARGVSIIVPHVYQVPR